MRKKVEYYSGHKINKKVLKRINLIDLKRIQEGITHFSLEEVNTLKELCTIHDAVPKQEHIILGEDWYIVYIKISDEEIEIEDWVAINDVPNKFAQTMEMLEALKGILIKNEQSDVYAMLRHSTSYRVYQKLLEKGYIEEGYDIIEIDDDTEELEKVKHEILDKYDDLESYLLDENRNRYEGLFLDDRIYHNVCFNITDEFIKRYKKSGR